MEKLEYIDYCTCTESRAKWNDVGMEYTCLTCHRPLGAYVPPLLDQEADEPRLPNEAYEAVLMDARYCYDCNTHYFTYHDCGALYER